MEISAGASELTGAAEEGGDIDALTHIVPEKRKTGSDYFGTDQLTAEDHAGLGIRATDGATDGS